MDYSDDEQVFMDYEEMEASSDDELEKSAAYYGILAERRRKLDGGVSPKTLQALCLGGIKKSSDFFLQMARKTNLNPFISLPNSLKTELLERDHFQKWDWWEELLLNEQVSDMKIDVNLLSSASFLMSTILKKPQFKAFACSGHPKAFLSVMCLPDLVGFTCTFSECFGNLQSLNLSDFNCNDIHLKTIGNNLLNLSTLSLELNGVTAKGISALSNLKYLQNFPFTSKSQISGDMTRLYNLCLQHLPQLLLFGWDEQSELAIRGYYDVVVEHEDFHIDFQSLPVPLELCLQQLVLHNKVGVIPESITFPNLTSLVLWYPVVDFQLDARFSKVKDLILIELGMPEYYRVLSILGHQIRKLAIVNCEQDLFLDLILDLCPNLEEFHIPSTPDVMSCSLPLEPAVDLQTLKVLTIDMVCYNDGSLISKFSPGVLLQLLKAPNLQYLRLFSIKLTKQDAEEIIKLLKEGQILQKLERVEVQHICIERKGMNSRHFKAKLRNRYDRVLENMAKYCPHFVHYKEHPFM